MPGYPLSILLGLTLIGITAICYHYKIKKSK
ncbi:MAG: Loki-CTERM sorting domain-containing protein [Promethearchaeia archaeon]